MPLSICPTITPKTDNDFKKVLSRVVAEGQGADMVFILGSTGEFDQIPFERRKGLAEIASLEIQAMRKFSGIPVSLAVGITGKNMEESLELARHAERVGVDYNVFMPLWVANPGEVGASVGALLREVKTPLILYNYPGRTHGESIGLENWKMFSQETGIFGLKDSSGDIELLRNYRAASDGKRVFAGNEVLGLRTPGDGVVAGSMNVLPVAWNYAIKRSEGEMGAHAGELLANFAGVYRSNPVGAFHYFLYRLGVIGTSEANNSKNELAFEAKKDIERYVASGALNGIFRGFPSK